MYHLIFAGSYMRVLLNPKCMNPPLKYYSQKSFLTVTTGAQMFQKLTTSTHAKYILVDKKHEVWGYIGMGVHRYGGT